MIDCLLVSDASLIFLEPFRHSEPREKSTYVYYFLLTHFTSSPSWSSKVGSDLTFLYPFVSIVFPVYEN